MALSSPGEKQRLVFLMWALLPVIVVTLGSDNDKKVQFNCKKSWVGVSFRLFLTPTHFPYCHVCNCSAAASGAPSTPSEEIVVFEPGEEVEEEVNQIEAQHLVDEDMVVAQIELDDIPGADDYNEEDTEEWGAMVDDSRNQDLGVTEVPEVNIQEALLRTEEQKKDLEMKNAKKLEKDRIVRISQKKRRIRYTAPGKYCKLCIFIVVLVIVLHETFVIYLISLMFV